MQRMEPGVGRKRAVDATVGTKWPLPRVVVLRCGGTEAGVEAGAALGCLECSFSGFSCLPSHPVLQWC